MEGWDQRRARPKRNPYFEKQLEYALNLNVPFLVLIGQNEVDQGVVNVKNTIDNVEVVVPRPARQSPATGYRSTYRASMNESSPVMFASPILSPVCPIPFDGKR